MAVAGGRVIGLAVVGGRVGTPEGVPAVPQGGPVRKGNTHWSRSSENTVPGSHSKWLVQ